MDDARLRAIVDELPAGAAPDAVLRVHLYGEEDEGAGYLAGNRAGLLRFARACLDAALAPNAPHEHITGDVTRGPEADSMGTAALFDGLTDLSVVGVVCEEPLERGERPAPPPRGWLAQGAPYFAVTGCLLVVVFAVLGAATFVRWAAS